MDNPDLDLDDQCRLRVLRQARLLDQPPEEAFDRLTRLAVRLLHVPIALVSLVDADRQFFKSQVGLPDVLAVARQTPLSHSFCKYVALSAEPLVVSDAREHPLLKDNPVIEQGVIAYAGVPLITLDGLVLGSFCAIDSKPREWTAENIADLKDFAASVMTEIELRRANEAKDRFFAMLSHELRTPLSPALLTSAELAADPTLPQRFREDAKLIHRNIELQTRMTDSLLDLTRITSGKLHLNNEQVDVHALLAASVEICQAKAAGKSIEVHLELRASRSWLTGDAAKLQQVFCNLLSNAIKFSRDKGHVTIRSNDRADGSLEIEVIDTGIGIPAQNLPTIFDAFQQGGHGITREFGGLGLGLAISSGIVSAHHGKISATSDGHNRGTTMKVVFPSAVAPLNHTPKPPAALPQSVKTVSILLVEDHEDTLRAMSRLLKKFQHNVVTANSFSKALEAAAHQDFDLLISDVGLPDGTGLELLQQLVIRHPIKGIALTGYGMEEDIQRTKNAGFQRHLTKPINFAELQMAIQELAT
jgi:signal transduction histidine kinase/CheY-like chemotaxis protein